MQHRFIPFAYLAVKFIQELIFISLSEAEPARTHEEKKHQNPYRSADHHSEYKAEHPKTSHYKSSTAEAMLLLYSESASILSYYQKFHYLEFKISSTFSLLSKSTQPPAWSSTRTSPSLSSVNSFECNASLTEVSLTLISEYGENGQGSAPP